MVLQKRLGACGVVGLGLWFIASCTGTTGPQSVGKSSAGLNAATPTIQNFVVYAANTVTLGSSDKSVGGNIGVATSNGASPQLVVGGQDALDVTRTLYAPAISVGNLALVGAVDTNSLTNSGGQVGSQSAYPSPMPPMPSVFAANPGTTNVTVTAGQQQTLSPNSYGSLTDNGTVFLQPGTYSFASVTLGNGAHLQGLQGGSTSVLIAGSLATGTGAQLLAGGQANQLTISVSGTDGASGSPPAVSIGAGSQLISILAAPNGSIAFGSNVQATGAFAAINVSAGNNVIFSFQSGFANALPNLSTFVAYAGASLTLGSQDVSVGGDIGVAAASPSSGAQLIVGAQAALDPNHTLYASSVSLGSQAIVGDVDSNTLTNSGAQSGTLEPYPASAMPALPLAAPVTATGNNVTVALGQQPTLPPGAYGTLTDDGILLLEPGAYSFTSVTLGNSTQIQAQGGPTTIAISGSLATGTFASIFPVGQPAGNLTVSVAGNDGAGGSPPAASLGNNTQIIGLLSVPHGTLSLGSSVQVTGAISGFSIVAGNLVQLNFQSGFPPAPPPSPGVQQLSGYFNGTVLSTAPIVGPVPQSTVMTVAVGLPVKSLPALKAFVQNVSDPTNSMYGSFVPPGQFAMTFGLSSSAYSAVGMWATGQGLTVSSQFTNNMVTGITGTAGSLGQALNVNFYYRSRPDGTQFYALDREPSLALPAQSATILYIEGLQNYQVPASLAKPTDKCAGGLCFSQDFRDAYVCSTLNGSGQSIGIINGNNAHVIQSDFAKYQALMQNTFPAGTTLGSLTVVPVDGEQPNPILTGINVQGQAACYASSDNVNCNPPPSSGGQGTCNPTCTFPTTFCNSSNTCVCPNSGTLCGEACTDTQADPNHCGACGTSCSSSQTCVSGVCTCAFPMLNCGGTCKDVFADANNCGGCGTTCPSGQVCAITGSGSSATVGCISTSCPSTFPNQCPNGGCVNTAKDILNCGSCGNVCPPGASCNNGTCTCGSGLTFCRPPNAPGGTRGVCTDTNVDPMNCGGCAGTVQLSAQSTQLTFTNVCTAANGTPFCSNGVCKSACDADKPSTCGGGQHAGFSPGIGSVCPPSFSQCQGANANICCPHGYACGDGGPGSDCPAGQCCETDDGEPDLDVEVSFGMAPAANIFSFESPTFDSEFSAIASKVSASGKPVINQISASWNWCADGVLQQLVYQLAVQGQSVFIASGDSSAQQTPGFNTWNNPCPAVGPVLYDVREIDGATIVGGTIVSTNTPTPTNPEVWQADVAWDTTNAPTTNSPYSGSTGAICPESLIPPYQAAALETTGGPVNPQISTTNRNIPDVSMPAENTAVVVAGGTGDYLGTSIASPLWAGYAALMNQQEQLNKKTTTVGFLNPAIYNIGATFYQNGGQSNSTALCGTPQAMGSAYAAAFHDVQDCTVNTSPGVASNACTSPGGGVPQKGPNCGFTALPGYDLVTGWGSPTCAFIQQVTCEKCGCTGGSSCNCVDLATDPNNCGTCGNQCYGGHAGCLAGKCQPVVDATTSWPIQAVATDGSNLYIGGVGTLFASPIVDPVVVGLTNGVLLETSPSATFQNLAVDPSPSTTDQGLLFFSQNVASSSFVYDLPTSSPPQSAIHAFPENGNVGNIAAFGGKVFWLEGPSFGSGGGPAGVYTNLNNPFQLVLATNPTSVAVDSSNVYWTDNVAGSGGQTNGVILQLPLSGTASSIALSIDDGFTSSAIFVDPSDNDVYWLDTPNGGGAPNIMQAPIGESGMSTVLVSAATLAAQNATVVTNPVSDGSYVYFGVTVTGTGSLNGIWAIQLGVSGAVPTVYANLPPNQTALLLTIDSQNVYFAVNTGTGYAVIEYPSLFPGAPPL
jgi:hypothetical protein